MNTVQEIIDSTPALWATLTPAQREVVRESLELAYSTGKLAGAHEATGLLEVRA